MYKTPVSIYFDRPQSPNHFYIEVFKYDYKIPDSDSARWFHRFLSEDTITSNLVLKTSFWEALPWKLCGLGSSDFEQARECGRSCVRLWNQMQAQSDSARSLHHPITRRFLDPVTRIMPRQLTTIESFVISYRVLGVQGVHVWSNKKGSIKSHSIRVS